MALHIDLFGDIEGLALIDAEIGRRTADALVAQKLLARRQIAGLVIDDTRLGAPHAVRTVMPGIEAGARRPRLDQPRVLTARQRMVAALAGKDLKVARKRDAIQ